MSGRRAIILGAAALILASGAQAQTATTFTPGTPALSSQVNAAFASKLDFGPWTGGTLCGSGLGGTALCSGVAVPAPVITGGSADGMTVGLTTQASGAFTTIKGYGFSFINVNAVTSPPTPMTGTVLQIVQADGSIGRVEIDAFGNWGSYSAVRYDGTLASPTAVQSSDEMGGFSVAGYDGTAATSSGKLRCYAQQNFSVGNHGTSCWIAVTANGSATLLDQFGIGQNGGAILGSPTGAAVGQGVMNVQVGYDINGVALACGQVTGCLASTLNSSRIFVGNGSNLAIGVLMSGDCTISNAGLITCTESNGVGFGGAAFQGTGTSGHVLPFMDGTNSWSGANAFARITTTGTAPAITAGGTDCGTSPSAVGNDQAFRITVGSGANGSKCTVTFHTAFTTNAPICRPYDETGGAYLGMNAPSTTTLVIIGTMVAGDTISVLCAAYT